MPGYLCRYEITSPNGGLLIGACPSAKFEHHLLRNCHFRRAEDLLAFGILDCAGLSEEPVAAGPPAPRTKSMYRAMKTVEETKTGLPSIGRDWPKKTERRREPVIAGKQEQPARLDQLLPSSIWESDGRGVQGYDSPLAG